jgi:hypothetical protein
MVDDPNLQAVFRMRRSEEWTPEDTAHRSGGLPMAQPEQEPVAWMDADGNVSDNNDHKCFPIPLYTTPPQRTWVGLTKEEIAEFDAWHDNREEEVGWCNPSEIVAYIDAILKEKNGYTEEKNT